MIKPRPSDGLRSSSQITSAFAIEVPANSFLPAAGLHPDERLGPQSRDFETNKSVGFALRKLQFWLLKAVDFV